jgi:hypothetical protein
VSATVAERASLRDEIEAARAEVARFDETIDHE